MNWFKSLVWVLLLGLIRLRFLQVKQLATGELAAWLEGDGPKPLLLDVRKPEEYQVSHLAGAQLAPRTLSELVATTPPETPIVVYCSVGYRSSKLAQALQQAGYKQVFNLEGSIFRWMNEGRSVYRDGQDIQQVHPYNKFWQWFLQSHTLQK